MAGVRITQLRPQHATGRRYGSFASKALSTPGLLFPVSIVGGAPPVQGVRGASPALAAVAGAKPTIDGVVGNN